MYNTILEVKSAFNKLLGNMYNCYCKGCRYPDCMGYIHILPSELDDILIKDVDLVKLNDEVIIIDSLEIFEDGTYNLEAIKPVCKYRKDGKCSIHNFAPFACCIYPFGFYLDNNSNLFFTISKDCNFSDKYVTNNCSSIFKDAINILLETAENVFREIIDTYCAISKLSKYPEGVTNSVYKLAKITEYKIEYC